MKRTRGCDSAGRRKKIDNLIKAQDCVVLFQTTFFLFLTPLPGPGAWTGAGERMVIWIEMMGLRPAGFQTLP